MNDLKDPESLSIALQLYDHICIEFGLETAEKEALGVTLNVSDEMLEKISHMIGIHEALSFLYQNPEEFRAWLRAPNLQFSSKTPLSCMLMGTTGLFVVMITLKQELPDGFFDLH